jgi:hypothetical protein
MRTEANSELLERARLVYENSETTAAAAPQEYKP